MLKKMKESFCSKVGEKLADSAVDAGIGTFELKEKLQYLKSNSRTLGYVSSDIERQVKNEELRGKKRKREVGKWSEMVQESERDSLILENEIQGKGLVGRLLTGDWRRVAKVNARVGSLIEQRRHFDGIVLDAYETRGEPLLLSRLSGETVERNMGRIWECLVIQNVPIMGIYGRSGVGKTTLAKHIHNRVLQQTGDHVYWVRVAQDLSIKNLQDDIAKAMDLTLSDMNDEDKRAAELNRALIQKRSPVLILDDVRKDIDLEKVGVPLSADECRVTITTRTLRVCRLMGCQEKFELTTLDENEAWNLFKERFGEETTLAPQVQEIAESMVRKQGGLPQEIIKLARSMKGVTEIQEWNNELEEMEEELTREGDEMEGENIRSLGNS